MSRSSSPCRHCGHSVDPTPEGYCPSCVREFEPAANGQTEFEVSPPTAAVTQAVTSPLVAGVTKVAIVLVVFPVLARVISFFWTLAFSLPYLLVPESARADFANVTLAISFVAGVVSAFLISRKVWPEKPVTSW